MVTKMISRILIVDTKVMKTRLVHSILVPVLGIVAAVALTGCGGSSSSNKPATQQGSIRVVHASPDAPAVNVKLDGNIAVSDLDYANSTGFVDVVAKDYDITVEGIIPGGNMDVISVADFPVVKNGRTTVIATDVVASITPLVISDSAATPASDEVALRVVHASPAAAGLVAEVDVYITAPGDDIAAATPALTFAFQEDIDAGALSTGLVQIRATGAGSKNVVFDSGPVDLTPFAGSKLMVAAIDSINSTEQAGSPIKLLVATDSEHVILLDTNTLSGARVVHASPDVDAIAGPVEVFASSSALPASPVELIDSFSYLEVVPGVDSFVGVPAGDYVFDVAPDTDTIGDSVFTSDSVNMDKGSEYTVIAAGRVASSPAFGLLLTKDNLRAVATQASVKVIHAAPAAGVVQVYVTAAGDFSATDIEAGIAGDPLLPDFAFGDITDDVAVPSGNYDVRVVAGGAVAINVENFNLAAGSVSTVIARGPNELVGVPNDFGVVVLTN
jgi:hypothetical protein